MGKQKGSMMSGTVYTVSNSSELYEALANANGGDTIELAPGDYGNLNLSSQSAAYDAPVTIISADPQAPASFSQMNLNGVANLTFDNVVFDYTYNSADELWSSPFLVTDSSNITIRNSVFDGDVASGRSEIDDGYGFAKGLTVRASSGVSIENNEFTTWHRGLVVEQSEDIAVRGNEVHSIRSDGLNFVEVQSVIIEDNYIHDFKGSLNSGDHRDMIQFWTTGTDTPSTDIIIRNNVLNSGRGDFTQSIFMRNEVVDLGSAGTEMFYRNITIEENVIINAHLHGITVGETDGLRIQNNTVVRNFKSEGKKDNISLWTPKITVAQESRNVEITRNVTSRIAGGTGQADWIIKDNFFVQDSGRMKPGFYGRVFVPDVLRDPSLLESFTYLPDGPLDKRNIGAARLKKDF